MNITIQDIQYVANVREVREKVTEVADFAIPSDVIRASIATAAGQLLVSTGTGTWDILAAPASSGLAPLSDLSLAQKWKLAVPSATNIDRIVQISLNASVALAATDRAKFRIPSAMNGMVLTVVKANVGVDNSSGSSSSGIPTWSIQDGVTNMLSTNLSVNVGAYDSNGATTPAVIDAAHNVVATDDIINVEVVAPGTGVTYAVITLVFRLP